MTRAIIFIALSLASILHTLPAGAGEKSRMAYRGFTGGMMIHSGYVQSGGVDINSSSGSRHVKVSGAPFGIGGAIRFMFGKHLRVGGEGYVSNLTYGEHKSHAKTGWGGLLADCVWDFKGCSLFVGGTVGGGGQTNTIILSHAGNDYSTDDIAYRKYSFAALAPFVGVEIPVTSKINAVIKADWLFNVSNRQDDFAAGPRIYIGIMFGHKK